MLNSFLGSEFGFNPEKLGLLWSVIFLVSAAASQFTSVIVRVFRNYSTLVVGLVIAISFVVSPFVGVIIRDLYNGSLNTSPVNFIPDWLAISLTKLCK